MNTPSSRAKRGRWLLTRIAIQLVVASLLFPTATMGAADRNDMHPSSAVPTGRAAADAGRALPTAPSAAVARLDALYDASLFGGPLPASRQPLRRPGACDLDDASYSWWTQPIAHDRGGKTRLGSVSSTGEIESRLDCAATEVEDGPADDHNAPAVISHSSRSDITFWTGHNVRNEIRFRRGDGRMGAVPFAGRVAYVQALTSGDRIVLLTRVNQCAWYLSRSDDWASSWRAAIALVDDCANGGQVYLTTKPHHAKVGAYRIAVYGHPHTSTWRAIEYGLINVNDGRVTIPAVGEIANIRTGAGLPLGRGELDAAYTPPAGVATRLLDVGQVGGAPLILFAEWTTPSNAEYVTARYVDGDWRIGRSLPRTGSAFWEPSMYVGGTTITDAGDVALARKAGSTWRLEQYRLTAGWTLERTFDTGSSPIVRPYAVRGGGSIIAQAVTTYVDYTHFRTAIVEYDLADPTLAMVRRLRRPALNP